MNILLKIIITALISLLSFQTKAQDTYTLTVNVVEADTNDGKMFIALYNAEGDFLKTKYKATISAIKNKQCTITFNGIPEGIYAVSVFHDENDNGKMDTNFMHIPKEDYGCSNGATGFMGPPKWEDAKFDIKADKTITITL
ncbi:DUF2141 domain-containing protein [Winogradskyella psychrotolerans]|uniref:DUF2141 domain-containing protein n=1 Tax=Winogradskyella psychrotolerans TaxID=1344585 RepID=UPI001C06FA3D|nr:DUF2141 domain-containing protein [Winogradskyella psychrotolerans]MBU2930266.1 DUF2141 domain-containing protein [Winogradskyella psychrotolerans]